MLDATTKRRIDTARDILVGKVPDPKSQVEQITIALIYKFMDDIDAQSEELGGHRSFFAGEFAQYGWAKLMRAGLGGYETLNLYAEAITRMPENPGVPPLFRDIFNNAYLPYRDPETLRLFLKVIDEFSYDHSERLGDAFEYLLSVLGSQGDAGQFRTPRHIIDFIVEIIDPRKDETVLDPACGTSGFLISSYKRVLAANSDHHGNLTLTPDERARLVRNFRGYDISPDMVRLSLANMYLHGFPQPAIYEYDTLTSEDRWNDYADVILANPPFMSPKGGIRPHSRFSVKSRRSEVLFVDYIAEHLTPNGRAGVIVPEGVIFQSQNAHKQLRKMLVEEYLVAVISLPAGVFQPYSGVKTSILIMDKSLARRTDSIAFFKIENDGYDLGAQRRPIADNDLPAISHAIRDYLDGVLSTKSTMIHEEPARYDTGSGEDGSEASGGTALVVSKDRIAEGGEYSLSGEQYRENHLYTDSWPNLNVGHVFHRPRETVLPNSLSGPITHIGLENISQNTGQLVGNIVVENPADIKSTKNIFRSGDILYGRLRPNLNKVWLADRQGICSTDIIVLRPSTDNIMPGLYAHIFREESFNTAVLHRVSGAQLPRISWQRFESIEIPILPLELQREIVSEIQSYQKVIDGAQAVIDNYRPHIPIDPDWPSVSLDAICQIRRGKFSHRPRNDPRFYGGQYPFIQTGDVTRANGGKISFTQTLNDDGLAISRLFEPPIVVITIAANIGETAVLDFPACFPDSVIGLIPKPGVDAWFLEYIMRTKKEYLNLIAPRSAQKNINIRILKAVKIPLPPLKIQQAIVAEIQSEQSLVSANHQLIQRMETKIQSTISRLWQTPNQP